MNDERNYQNYCSSDLHVLSFDPLQLFSFIHPWTFYSCNCSSVNKLRSEQYRLTMELGSFQINSITSISRLSTINPVRLQLIISLSINILHLQDYYYLKSLCFQFVMLHVYQCFEIWLKVETDQRLHGMYILSWTKLKDNSILCLSWYSYPHFIWSK